MKVLHVLNELMASGAEVMMCRSAFFWRQEGVENEFLSTGEEIGPYAKDLEEAGYRIHHLPFKKDFRLFFTFFNLVREGRYDIVHIHCERAAFYYGLTARMTGVRIMRTIHATFQFNGFLAVRRRVQRYMFRILGGGMVSVSPSVEKNELERLGNRTTLILNWYDNNRFRPPSDNERQEARNRYGIREDEFGVVSVGNCAPVKNHRELLYALAMIKAQLPLVYLHVGREEDGEPERKLAKELGLVGRTRFLGYTRDILPVLFAADCFVMPSIREGFSVAALEALGIGLPAVLADVSGLRDLKGISGTFWVDPEFRSLADGIRQVAAFGPEERQTLRQRTPQEVGSSYGMERGVRAYVALYEKLKRSC